MVMILTLLIPPNKNQRVVLPHIQLKAIHNPSKMAMHILSTDLSFNFTLLPDSLPINFMAVFTCSMTENHINTVENISYRKFLSKFSIYFQLFVPFSYLFEDFLLLVFVVFFCIFIVGFVHCDSFKIARNVSGNNLCITLYHQIKLINHSFFLFQNLVLLIKY